MFPGASRLDRRIQGQQVGLLADLLNHVDHFADLLGAVCQRCHLLRNCAGGGGDLFHGGCRGLHHRAALIGGLGGDSTGSGGALGVVADLADGGGHLLRRRSNLVGLAGLGVCVACALDRAGADLDGGGGERIRTLRHRLQYAAHGSDAGVQGGGKTADLVAAALFNAYRQVFFSHTLQGRGGGLQGWGDEPGELEADECAEQNDEECDPSVDPRGVVAGERGALRILCARPGVDSEAGVRRLQCVIQ